ncbi:MAG: hypothetical protein MRZ36_02725 [Eubacterium sp.]|nr:hypothetical protein [Eubacterium sp.]
MNVNGITNLLAGNVTASTASKKSTEAASTTTDSKTATDLGVTYEPSASATDSDKTKTSDYSAIVANMKAELANKNKQLETLVTQLLGKQATKATSLADMFRNLKPDDATIAQAQQEISDDGYWGVEKTSDRLVAMAQALSGGDSSKADLMIEAMEKGFSQATKAWGEDLPDICQKTIDAAKEKLTNWRDGITQED